MNYLHVFLITSALWGGAANSEEIFDSSRNRAIPVEVYQPLDNTRCTTKLKCPVAFLSAGYGVAHTQYTFLVDTFTNLGYMVVAIAHELPNDPPISVKGNLFETRSENWIRGAKTLDFLKHELQSRYLSYEFNALLLIGHSNGGDISSWLGNTPKPYIRSIITLDHRRVPLPRNKDINILSIRASDFPADQGVLFSESEKMIYPSCVINIPKSKHNDMSDYGPTRLKDRIKTLITAYLSNGACVIE